MRSIPVLAACVVLAGCRGSEDAAKFTTTPVISGRLCRSDGMGVRGVAVSASHGGQTDVTDADGFYEVRVPYGWSGLVRPQNVNYAFVPGKRSYSGVTYDLADQDFNAAPEVVTISGCVRDPEGNGVAGVIVSAEGTGNSTGTNATGKTRDDGNYTLRLPFAWSGTVTPAPTRHSFSPPSITCESLQTHLPGQDFTAGALTDPVVAGEVRNCKKEPIGGITLIFTGTGSSDGTDFTTMTNRDGSYVQLVPEGWSGTVTSDPNHRLEPASNDYTDVTGPLTGQDYAAFHNYFISPTGSDSKTTGGIDQPFATLKKALNAVTPGDTIYLRAGTYVANSTSGFARVSPTACGQPEAYITLRTYPGERAVIDSKQPGLDMRCMYFRGLSYWHVVGLEITNLTIPFDIVPGKAKGGTPQPSHDLIFEDCELHHLGAPIHAEGKAFRIRDNAHHIVIRNCRIHHVAGPGVSIAGDCHDILIEGCDSYDNDDGRGTDGDADGFSATYTSRWPYNITFRRCRAWNLSEDGFDIKGDNILYDRCAAWNAAAILFKLWRVPALEQTRHVVRNCLGYDAGESCLKTIGRKLDVQILNSTYAASPTGEDTVLFRRLDDPGTETSRIFARNNIFLHLAAQDGPNRRARALSAAPGWELDMDYNVYGGSVLLGRSTYSPADIEDGKLFSDEGQEKNGRGSFPAFIAPDKGDFHLAEDDKVAGDTGQDLSRHRVTNDLDGVSRPQGDAFDRGCYERR